MKQIFKLMTVMSISLLLFSVNTVAQIEKSTKSATYSYPKLQVSAPSVTLIEGRETTLIVTPDMGYYAVIWYNGEKSYLSDKIEGSIFTINPNRSRYETSSFVIKAKQYNPNIPSETIALDVEVLPEDLWPSDRSVTRSTRVVVTINVVPDLGQK